MNILITGGTGFIGHKLTKKLLQLGHHVIVLSRQPANVAKLCSHNARAISSLQRLHDIEPCQVIINLAGAPIFDRRWTNDRKQLLRDSRIGFTEQLIDTLNQLPEKPSLLISGSAIGYYGDQGDTLMTENAVPFPDFSQQLCADWEAAALKAENHHTRVCIIRTGLVLGANGGLLERMRLPFLFGMGGRLGDGKQWMSWIDRQDWINIVLAMIDNPNMRGAYNATAPNPVTNNDFTQQLAKQLKRPALLPLPAKVLKLLLGEMSELVLGSQRVIPDRLLAASFQFEYPNLPEALEHAFPSQYLID